MELFQNAKAVRLLSIYDKYLTADEDEETVLLDRNGSSKSAKWTVEYVGKSDNFIRLKSCSNKYLTALNHPYLLGTAGGKVVQTALADSLLVQWEPVKERNNRIKLKSRSGKFLRANGGLPPWRNSVTHDIPHRTAMQDTVIWEVHVVEIILKSPVAQPPPPPQRLRLEYTDNISSEPTESPLTFPQPVHDDATLVRSQSKGSEGRLIYYRIADEYGEVDEGWEEMCITFKGNGVDELAKILEEETGHEEIVVCTKSPLNGRLYPLHLHLPPNNATMHVIVVPSTIKVARRSVGRKSVGSVRTIA